jgi:hypothetical protein
VPSLSLSRSVREGDGVGGRRREPSILARRRGVSVGVGVGESRQDPGMGGIDVWTVAVVVSEVTLPVLVVGRSVGRGLSVGCRALARRDATPSENDGGPGRPESRDGTGCTPIMTNGTIRGSTAVSFESAVGESVENDCSTGVVGSTSIVSETGDSTTVVVIGVILALNRYINK